MRYVALDLEWDSGYSVRHERFVNQILQIGAVKMDEQFQVIDSFEATIRSAITKRVSGRFARLTGITSQIMREGIPPEEAVRRYNDWVGEDTVTMTWSTSDLYAILENEKYLWGDTRFKIDRYLDLQGYIQNEMKLAGHPCQSQISLADAAAFFEISTDDYELHTARDDSLVCVALLQKNYVRERFEPLIRDTANAEFYERLTFKPYYLNRLDDPLVDQQALELECEKCGSRMKRIAKWRYRNRWFTAKFYCRNCDEKFMGRVCFRKNFDDVVVRQRVTEIPVPTEQEVQNDLQSVPAELPQ